SATSKRVELEVRVQGNQVRAEQAHLEKLFVLQTIFATGTGGKQRLVKFADTDLGHRGIHLDLGAVNAVVRAQVGRAQLGDRALAVGHVNDERQFEAQQVADQGQCPSVDVHEGAHLRRVGGGTHATDADRGWLDY